MLASQLSSQLVEPEESQLLELLEQVVEDLCFGGQWLVEELLEQVVEDLCFGGQWLVEELLEQVVEELLLPEQSSWSSMVSLLLSSPGT